MLVLLFILFAGLTIGCAIGVVVQKNPLYSAISLIGVFVSLACHYVMLAAPFIAAVQVIVYAGAIMVLVVFVIMLLNVEQEDARPRRLAFLVPAAVVMAGVLIAEVSFILVSVKPVMGQTDLSIVPSDTGLTSSIGTALFTTYLLPFELTSILLLMAIVGAMTLASLIREVGPQTRVVPGAQVLALDLLDSNVVSDTAAAETNSTAESAVLLGLPDDHDLSERG